MDNSSLLLIALALISALAPTITALAAWRQSRINARLVMDTAAVGASLVKKTDEIHVLVNSNLARAINDLMLANARITALEDLVRLHMKLEGGSGSGGA